MMEEVGTAGNNLGATEIDHDEQNTFLRICRTGSIYELMEVTPFFGGDRHLLHRYDRHGRQCIHTVAWHDRANAVMKIEILMQSGVNINAKELGTGNTLLHIAASTGNYLLADWFCQQLGVDLGASNNQQETAYYIAYKMRDRKMMKLLRAHGVAYNNTLSAGLL
ncbi:viral ankyrin 2 [Bracoviriform demolitoris]|uniref:I-Kappa-B like protein F1 n=1 Tax=Microplitis demolitor bracovirus (isolate Webb) TaxID=654919 RepID=IKBF1_MDBVW|nr:uncharacterized LOC103579080 [Microplitis demolitor]YP_239372.1 viral ankyrin 2 [Bracoviriform demolitoris]Q5I156.1 RecName: Full=I-Kappa-B like protein F1 [Microplitis demolitor bracovirus (isolate Webb)]AAW51776.1 viral ankyrin 2 [Bracoviriform demolitoris]KAG6558523.1 viral ankyrin F4 [Microplitis demolitor]